MQCSAVQHAAALPPRRRRPLSPPPRHRRVSPLQRSGVRGRLSCLGCWSTTRSSVQYYNSDSAARVLVRVQVRTNLTATTAKQTKNASVASGSNRSRVHCSLAEADPRGGGAGARSSSSQTRPRANTRSAVPRWATVRAWMGGAECWSHRHDEERFSSRGVLLAGARSAGPMHGSR